MRTWNELSMAEKADVMKLAIGGGVYDLDSIRNGYNEFAKGGRIHIKPENRGKFTALKERTGHSASWFKEHGTPAQKKMATFALNARKWKHEDGGIMNSIMDVVDKPDVAFSTAMMKYIRNAGLTGNINPFTHKWSTTKDSPAQDTFLNLRDTQKREFLRRGWIEGKEGDYGLVRKAAESKGYPIYQRNPDAIDRNDLIVLGNTYEPLLDAQHLLPHSGSTPSAVYTDGQGNFYQKQWDLNDYGGNGGSTAGMLGKILDTIGSPTVVTSGFQPIDKNERLLSNPYGSPKYIEVLKPMMAQKGLVPTKIDGETKWTIPEVVITGKRRKRGDGGNLYGGGGATSLLPFIDVPGAVKGAYKAAKERIYKTVVPQDYDIPKATREFVSGKERDLNVIEPVRNEEWARYLGVPYKGESNFEPSPYRPTKGKTYDTVLKFKDESQIVSDEVLNQMLERQKKTGKNSFLVKGNGAGLGSYTLSLGEDENGKYISYYDDWDINPFKGVSANTNIPIISGIEDIVPGSNPFTVYGRRYYEKRHR